MILIHFLCVLIKTDKICDLQMIEVKMGFEQEKAGLLKDFHLQKEFIHGEQEKESENLKSLHRQEVVDLERRMHVRQEKDAKVGREGLL